MKKENIPFYVAIGAPILLVLIIGALSYMPKVFSKSDYNFLYSENSANNQYAFRGNDCIVYEKYYQISADGSISLRDFYIAESGEEDPEIVRMKACGGQPMVFRSAPDLYVFDFETNTSRKIAVDQLPDIKILDINTSPDGYRVSTRYSSGSLLDIFGGSDNRSGVFLIKNGNPVRRIETETSTNESYYSENDFRFIGWVDQNIKGN